MYRYAFLLLAAATPLAANAQATQAPASPMPATPGAQAAPGTATAPTAPTATAPTVGGTVYDAQGGMVGTIASTDGTNAVVDTGTVKAAIPLTSFGTGPNGPMLTMTKAELEAAAGQGAAAAAQNFRSQLSAGASVYGVGGASLGTIKAVDGEFVTVTTEKGDARLPLGSFGPGPQGVTIGMTAAQLDAAMAGQ
ncbi:hypothetical protein [Sphingomonas dokdonensis]|uniref:PRC-barrel domain protein n=1 Tax=Sphingomonas dokdonensis TaxID=344880 RepID=A0A245ZP52_9SPHN|nr:hypothetical protein [Sphingomonas dokdonensis]OWK31524.1 hypothetical protein SPDO_15340 [Sphingomonas dokdonensis]